MHRSTRLLVCLTLVACANVGYAQLLDHEGNPLPKGAIARVGSARMRHGGSVIGLSYLDEGKTLVSLTAEEVRWWDAATGKRKHGLDLESGYPRAFRFSKDGEWFQLYTNSDLVTISSRDGKELRRHKLTDGDEFKTVVADDAGLLASVENNSLRLFDMETGKEKHRIKPPAERPIWPAISQDGSTIALSYFSHDTVDIFDAKSGQLRTSVPRPAKDARRLFLSSDGKTLIVGGHKEPTDMWDLTGPRKVSTVTGEAAKWTFPVCAAFSPDGKHVALGNQWKYTVLIEIATGKEVHRFLTFPSCTTLLFSCDGKTLAIGTNNGEVTQWDVQTGKPKAASADPIGPYIGFDFANDDKHILASNDRHLLLDWKDNKVVQRFSQTPNYLPMKNSLHLKSSLIGYFDYENERVVMCDAVNGKMKWQVSAKQTWSRVLLSPDGTMVITAHDDGFRGWDAQTGKSLLTIKTTLTNNELYRLAISPNNQWLATSHIGAGIHVWDLRKKELAGDLSNRPRLMAVLTFSHDSRWLAAFIRGDAQNTDSWAVHKINLPAGSETVLQSTIAQKGGTAELAVSPDDRTIATVGYYNDNIRLYEITADQERCRFKAPKDTLHAVIFSSDGSLLATSSNGGPLLIWDVYGKHQRKGPPAERWSGAEQERLWQALASPKATEGFAAVCQLVQHPPAALVLLRERMKPARAVDVKKLQPLLVDLQSEQFATRQKAYAQLEKQGDASAGFLEKELPGIEILEAKRRVERLLDKWNNPAAPDRLRWNRALEALEQIADAPAQHLLKELAGGDPLSRSTIQAHETRDRLLRRAQSPSKP